MAKFNIYDRYKSTINIAVAVGAVFVGYTVYQRYKKRNEEEKANAAGQLASTELTQLAAQGIHPSYNDSQYQVFVDNLVQAMTGCGTDETAVQNVFRQMRNEADIRKLILQFGVQYYQPCVWTSPISYTVWQVNDQAYGGGLATWLGYDLSAGSIADLNGILKANGINYQF